MTMTKKFLRLPAVIEATGQSRSTILRRVKAGAFPAPIHLGPRAIAWDSADVARWQEECIAASRANG
jgi:prophage regulatory protein